MGRPTKYTPELLEKAGQYLDNYKEGGSVIPSHAGLALYLSIGKRTIYDWEGQEGKEEFSHILAKILHEQEQLLLNNGLNSTFNPTIVKLVLGKHGYSDKQQLEHSGEVKIERVMYTEQAGKKKPAPGRLSRLNEN